MQLKEFGIRIFYIAIAFLNFICAQQIDNNGINATESKIYDKFRLPTSIRPEHYKIKIITHLDGEQQFQFTGKIILTFNVIESTQNITLHSNNLTIDPNKINIKSLKDGEPKYLIKNVLINPDHDYYIIMLSDPLQLGKHQIYIPYSGKLNKNLMGYYRSSYRDQETKKRRWLSTTQFEPTSARSAFPCFDEPEMKAKFKIFLAYKKLIDNVEYKSISNMPLKNSVAMTEEKGWVWDEFEESIPMSTYLVAYTINDFDYKESTVNMKNNVTFRTWARPDAIDQTDYASKIGPQILQYYEEYFDIKFPLPKMDQIAIPDFSAGAMENWGLVTYRETALLYSENSSSSSSKHRVASVVSHELAHQWFGNLVTMKWWTDLWLNEGFATYVASLGIKHIHPEWNALLEESVDNTLTIFRVDALRSSHPVSVEIGPANEIPQIFDSISYDKGSCVLRMMHLFLGEQTFRRGITNYLKKNAYSNAEQDNLWASLTDVAHKLKSIPENLNIKEIMDSWTLQTGYPIVTVFRDYTENGGAVITQSRYLLDTYSSRDLNSNCWYVPLSYTTQSKSNFHNTTPQNWLTCPNKEMISINLDNIAKPDEWIIFNIQMSGLYKVKYDEKNWDLLIDTLMSGEFKKIHVVNRAQLIDDALTLAWTGDQDYGIAMRLIEYLRQENEYIPWKSALSNLRFVDIVMKKTPDYEFFKKYMKKILSPIYEKTEGLNITESMSKTLDSVKKKILIASWACRFDVGDCISKSEEYFKLWQYSLEPEKFNPIPIDLRSVIYCSNIRHGGEDEWNFLWEQYLNSNVASEKSTILRSLGCSQEPWLISRYLVWAFNDTQIRKQDSFHVFDSVTRSQQGFYLAKEFLLENIADIYNFYAPETSKISRLIRPLASQMNTNSDLEIMREFTKKNEKYFEKNTKDLKRAIETIEVNSQWKARNYDEMSNQLRKFS